MHDVCAYLEDTRTRPNTPPDTFATVATALHTLPQIRAISRCTAKTHVGRILMKRNLRDRVQAVVLADESGFVKPENRFGSTRSTGSTDHSHVDKG